jgi:hypothetical protein
MRDENYRPANIEFDVAPDDSSVPETFGQFDTADEAVRFLANNLTAINQAITVSRHMDTKEKMISVVNTRISLRMFYQGKRGSCQLQHRLLMKPS